MKFRYSTLIVLLSFGLILGIGLLPQSAIVRAQGLEVPDLTKNSCYAVTNQSATLGTYQHAFYEQSQPDPPIHTFDDTIPAFGTKTYNLADIPQIPPGFLGRVVIQADVPSSASKVSCSGGPDSADLAVTKAVDDSTSGEGDTIIYTITITNNGPDQATGVQITDQVPVGVTYISDNSGGAYNPGNGVWTVGSLANGASATLLITASVGPGTAGLIITNTANVSAADQSDPTPGNNAASADITVEITPPTSVSISGPTTGETDTAYTFTANVSPSTASLPLTYLWQATDQSSITHTSGGLSDTVNFTWSSPGTKVINVTASNAGGNATDNHTIIISITDTTPPAIDNIQKSSEYVNKQGCASPNTITFRADVTDSSGLAWVRLYYQPPGEVWAYATMSLEAGNTYKATIGPFNQVGKMPYYIKARDSFNNPKALNIDYISVACVSISHVEVIQVTQNVTNTVPLIAGKPALVRVYVDCGVGCESAPGVTGTLRISTSTTTYTPDNENGSVEALHSSNWNDHRDHLDETLNFLIPGDFLSGTVSLTATVGGNVSNGNGPFSFRQAKELNVVMVPIKYENKVPETSVMHDAVNFARLLYPTDAVNVTWYTSPLEWTQPLTEKRDKEELIEKLKKIIWLDILLGQLPSDVLVYGFLPKDSIKSGRAEDIGAGIGASSAAIGDYDSNGFGKKHFVHELGHLMDQHHTNTEDNLNHLLFCLQNKKPKHPGYKGTDDKWKAYVDLTSTWPFTTSLIQDYGFQLDLYPGEVSIHTPGSSFDFMSYCGWPGSNTSWTSPWTYEEIYDKYFQITSITGAFDQELIIQSSAYVIVGGLVFSDDTTIREYSEKVG